VNVAVATTAISQEKVIDELNGKSFDIRLSGTFDDWCIT
jgi:hypothetical protein